MSPSIAILAAGQGTRMKSDLPKVMHPLAGRPMVCHVVDIAQSLAPDALALVIGHGASMVREAVGEGVTYAIQKERLGTGDAVLKAEEALAGRAGTVLVLYGDTPLIRAETLQTLLARHEAEGAAITLLTFRPDNPAGYGRIVRDSAGEAAGRAMAVVEDRDATPEQRAIGEVNSGILAFRDEWLWPNLRRLADGGPRRPGQKEIYLTDLIALAGEQGETVIAVPAGDPLEVIGLDHRVKLAQAEAELRRRINERWMLAGVTLVHPEATYIESTVDIGADTIIWPNTFLQGQTRVGRGCALGPGTIVRDSTLGDGCRAELSVIEQAIMEDGSEIGPFGHLRKGAHLGPGVHMGNFGEVKNSYLGPGAKMGHFSYLGDATVGAGANIGAGTITCNYDGQRKHPTAIGADAFIGSDTMLVAPVTVGAGARTGAGSVVTRDVPDDSLAYGVPARIRPSPGPDGPDPSPDDKAREDR